MNKCFHTKLKGIEIEDRIANNLSRAMVCDVSATVGLDDFDTKSCEGVLGGDEVFSPLDFSPSPEGDDGRMFEKEELFFGAFEHVLMCLFLNVPGVAIGD